jgi:polyisoprenyl-phosphate glycosyltransferase
MTALCVVVPCFNEEDVMPTFLQTVPPQLEAATDGSWRIIFIDDGSTDGTLTAIAEALLREPRIGCLHLSRNFGHQAALSAGLAFAEGEYIGIIDADLQDPIDVLLQLFRRAQEEQLDVCYGIRSKRDAPLYLKVAYKLYYKIIERLAEHHWPRDAGDFCVISARCHRVLLSLPEHSRLLRGLRSWVGFKQQGIPYHRPARLYGETKYSLRKLVALALQGLIAFSSVPLRMASTIGILLGFSSLIFGVLLLVNRLFPRFTILGYWVGANPGTATIVCFLALVFSVLFLCIGVLGEYLVVLLQEVKQRPTAIVAETLGDLRKNEAAWQVIDCGAVAPAPSQILQARAVLSRVSNLVPENDRAKALRATVTEKSATTHAGQYGE